MVKKNSHFFFKVPLSNTYDFDSSALVVYMNYAKHGLYISEGKAKETYYFLLCKKKFTFIRFAATRFKIKQCYKTNQNSSKLQ